MATKQNKATKKNKLKLQLGDIIEISAPTDPDINNQTFLIEYIDADKIRLEEPGGREVILTLTEGNFDNEAIENIKLKGRAEEEGYARQNNLLVGVWIDIFFGGDLPATLTGQISNLENDKIEITTFPEKETIFIDFGYQGFPEDLPIEKIQIRRAPEMTLEEKEDMDKEASAAANVKEASAAANVKETSAAANVKEAEDTEGEKKTMPAAAPVPAAPVPAQPKVNEFQEQMRTLIFNADQIHIGEDLESVTRFIDVPEEEQRYDIDKQLEDLLDNILSTIPNVQRTETVKNNIHKMIQRFTQLRDTFSVFDQKGHALMPKAHGANYKPLLEHLEHLDTQLYWTLPVVKYIKKIYEDAKDDETEFDIEKEKDTSTLLHGDDTVVIALSDALTELNTIVKKYETNDTNNEANKYAFLQKELNPLYTPFLEHDDTTDCLTTLKTQTDITGISDNYYSFKYKRFAFQKYITGATGLELTKVRGEGDVIKRRPLTMNDTVSIKSLMTLPEPTLRFSRVNLPSTHILDKSNLNIHFLNYWQLLHKNLKIAKVTIKDLNKPYNYDDDAFFLKNVTTFVLQDLGQAQPVQAQPGQAQPGQLDENESKYHRFLNAIIPKTKFLFNHIKPYLDGKLSITAILAYLEPFLIYQTDLTFMQYNEMNDYIGEKITEYRKKFISKAREYAGLKGTNAVYIPPLIQILNENQSLKDKVLDVYGFTNTIMQMSNADFLKRILEIDAGIFYNTAVALTTTSLMIANGREDLTDIDNYLHSGRETKEANETKGKTKGKPKEKTAKNRAAPSLSLSPEAAPEADAATARECNKIKIITKRYIELDELMEDNGKEIFYDKKYDMTMYDMAKADKNLPLSEQIKFYMAKIMKVTTMDEMKARREAEAIIKGKRTVEDGEYAILETTDEQSATVQYYVRNQENWVLDETIDSETFADNLKMFCNLNEKCIAVKETCKDETTGANELKKHNLELLLKEFDTNLSANKDIVVNTIENELNNANMRMEVLRNLKTALTYKYDQQKNALGQMAETKEHKVSPYDDLLNAIMGQADMTKRYIDIDQFVKSFTREAYNREAYNRDTANAANATNAANASESIYWLYCIKSDKPMLPTFIHTLATAFLTNQDYEMALDDICTKQGTLSEDGDKWIDKHSGYTIKLISMSTDEEYNEAGFKIITRSVLESDIGETLLQDKARLEETAAAAQKPERKFSTPDANTIYNVIETMAQNLGIDLEAQKEFIVRNVLKQLSNTSVIPPKTAYEKQLALLAAKGKTIDTYENAFNSILLYMTLSYLLIAIQISTPPIKTKTTFPGCKKAFNGFPSDGTDNMKGVIYIACVANKIKSKASQPWLAIVNRNANIIAKQMEANTTKFILPTEDVQNGIKELKVYMEKNPEISIPNEHNVENWQRFLPPLRPIKMATVQDVGEVFKSRLSDSLRKGEANQQDYISEVQAKMILFSYSIIDLIEKTVQGEQAVLRSKSGEPFMENACCEASEMNTLQYFISKQPDIAVMNNKVARLSDIYDDAKNISKAAILYDPTIKPPKIMKLDDHFSETTIYRAFIIYCRFNSFLPLSENVKAICPTKPDNFEADDTLEESIRKLKSNARNYSEQSLQQLLEVINRQNKQLVPLQEKVLDNSAALNAVLSKMDAENVRPSLFRGAFAAVLEQFDINGLMEDTEQLRKLKNILARLNEDMQKQILEFVQTANINTKKANIAIFKDCLATIMQFKETGDNMVLNSKEETGYKMVNFMKKTMRCLTSEYPNIVINHIRHAEQTKIPKHWKVSQTHEKDLHGIIVGHYTSLNALYGDSQIKLVLEKFSVLCKDITDLAQQTLLYAPVEMKGKRQTTSAKAKANASASAADAADAAKAADAPSMKYTVFDLDLTTLLFRFYFLSALTDLISLQNDQTILQLPFTSISTTDDEALFMRQAEEMDVLAGNQVELADKIVTILVTFTNLICKDKSAIDYNYKSLMELLLRAKEKEKDDITDYLHNMSDEERAVENLFKANKLERWSKGAQKGIHTYDTKTYDQEREEMEKMALREVRLNKKSVVTDMNRDIYSLEMMATEEADAAMDQENSRITYMGEDAEPEDDEMDGDEDY